VYPGDDPVCGGPRSLVCFGFISGPASRSTPGGWESPRVNGTKPPFVAVEPCPEKKFLSVAMDKGDLSEDLPDSPLG